MDVLTSLISNRSFNPESMIRRVIAAAVIAVAAASTCVHAQTLTPSPADEREVLTRDQWPQVRTGRSVMALEPLRRVITRFESTARPVVLIRFPGGNLGNAWAFELRDWLVALGIPSSRITLEPGSGIPDGMALFVLDQV